MAAMSIEDIDLCLQLGKDNLMVSPHLRRKFAIWLEKNVFTDAKLVTVEYDYSTNDGSIILNICGNVFLPTELVEQGRLKVKFRTVSGDFSCEDCGLVSLEGTPRKIGGEFNCAYNKLTSLKDGPKEVGWNYYAHNNLLTNLEGAPEIIFGTFSCSDNQLTSLEGGPLYVQRLKKDFESAFLVINNKLKTLSGGLRSVDFLSCGGNDNLELGDSPPRVYNEVSCGTSLNSYSLAKLKQAFGFGTAIKKR